MPNARPDAVSRDDTATAVPVDPNDLGVDLKQAGAIALGTIKNAA
jgi:hypothetical protein